MALDWSGESWECMFFQSGESHAPQPAEKGLAGVGVWGRSGQLKDTLPAIKDTQSPLCSVMRLAQRAVVAGVAADRD